MAFIETDPVRSQMAAQIAALRAEALNRLAQVDALMARIRDLQLQMAGSPYFTKDDLAEVDGIVDEIHASVSDAATKPAPVKLEPVSPAPVEVVAATVP
jgi:hypothetical protein